MKHLFAFSLFLISTLTNAQTVCDSLEFVSIKYSPFTDSVIVVHVENSNTNEIFDYPGFVLLDANDDTVAMENVNYFGIGSESVHRLEVRPGVHDPLNNFEGTLQLYSGFYDTFECEWDVNQSLCADDPCDSVILGFENWGGALVTGDFHWELEDDNAALVDSGSFTMVANNQSWFYPMCLEPGTYTYSLTALTQPSGGGPTLTVYSYTTYASPSMSTWLDWFNNPGAELEFPFFDFCAQSSVGVGNQDSENDIRLLRNGNDLVLESQHVIEKALIYSMDGRLVDVFNPYATRLNLSSNIPHGAYLIRVQTSHGWSVLKVVQ